MEIVRSAAAATMPSAAGATATAATPGNLSYSSADAQQFRAALDNRLNGAASPPAPAGDGASLGGRILDRANELAMEVQKDHAYVSRMLEQATRSADSMQLMRAMMALSDYQIRVQFISKAASKASQSVDQLTKLQ